MNHEPLNDEEMLESTDEFAAAYESHAKSIYKFLYWRTKNTQVSEDLTSSVFEKAWRSRGNFHGGSVRAWLYRIACNTLIDHWRKQKELPVEDVDVLPDKVSDPSLGEALDKALQAEQLQRAVNRLPADMRAVVRLRFMKGLSCKQTAKRLALSESNVRVVQYRALKKIRGYLQ
jgi:RNA polymerase sigma-70 factor (ECF subfamily)